MTTEPGPPARAGGDPFADLYSQRARGMTPSQIRSLFAVASQPEVVSLAGGMPYVQALPLGELADTVARLIRERGHQALQYGSGQGDPVLREQVCEVMAEVGIGAPPDSVVITSGSQLALDLLVRVLVDPGDAVLAESPSYVGALGVFAAYGAKVVHLPMDDEGLLPDAIEPAARQLRAAGRRPKMLYTIPSFHNPAGVTQGPQRRLEVMRAARRAGLLIVEDDPYGLLGFDDHGPWQGRPPRAMAADDPDVVYLGSFSKTVAAGLRVGWAMAPAGIRDRLVLASEAAVLCPSSFTQLTVSEYLATQPWREQVDAFRREYRTRRDALCEQMAVSMPDGVSWTVPTGGFYSWVTLPEWADSVDLLPVALAEGVAYVPGTGFRADGVGRGHLRLSYCNPEPNRVREGVRRLARALGSVRPVPSGP